MDCMRPVLLRFRSQGYIERRISKKHRETAIYDYFVGALSIIQLRLFDGIMSMPPGHWMSVSLGVASVFKNIGILKIAFFTKDEMDDAVQRYEELLRESISLQARSDVPVATFLSGGVDSSIVSSQLVKSGVGGRGFHL